MQKSDGLVKQARLDREASAPRRHKRSGLLWATPIIAFVGTFTMMTIAIGLEDVVADRQREMKEIAAATKTISDMFKAPETYSAEFFKVAARAISERADQRLVDHFASVTVAEGSKATNEVATDHDRFGELARDLKTYADTLASAADRHPSSMSEDMRMKQGEPMGGGPLGTRMRKETTVSSMSAEHAFHLMLQTCTSCHSRFRLASP